MEIPSDLIHKVQVDLRKQAGIPSYDPAGQSLLPLPSLHDALAKLLDNPSSVPSYLRCSRCHRQLLRGIRSTLCVFCGQDPRSREGFSHSISFTSTAAYRNLLQSLCLDGSEAINFDTESNDSTKSQNIPNSGLVLSSLLDLELRWPSEKETVNSNIDKAPVSTQAVNLSGVDLNTFFFDSRNETTSSAPSVSSEHLMSKEQDVKTESSVSPGLQDFQLFENLQSSNMEVSSTKIAEGHDDDSFADWEAELQSASSDTFPPESISTSYIQDTLAAESASSVMTSSTFAAEYKSVDLFHGPSSIELVNHARISSTLNRHTYIESETSNRMSSGEHTTSWGQFSSSGMMVPNDLLPYSVDDIENIGETHNNEVKNEMQILSPVNNSWGQEFPTDKINESDDIRNKKCDNDDVFEDSSKSWNDFTSSMDASQVLTDSRLQTVSESLSYEHSSTTNSVDIRDMEFGSFKHSIYTSGALFNLEGSTEANSMKTTASASVSLIVDFKNTKDVEDDDLEIWQDFTSSNEASVNMSNLLNQSDTEASSNENISATKLAISKNMDFASIVHSDFSGVDSSEVSEVLASASCRNEFHSTKHINDNYNALEALQNFTNSSEEPANMSSLVSKTGTEVSSNEHIISGTAFVAPKDSSGASGCQKGTNEVNEVSASASSIIEFHSTKDINDNDDSLEAWQEFTGLKEALGGFSSSWTTGTEAISIEPASGITSVEPQDVEFGSFFQSHSFSEVGGHKGSNKVNTIEIDALLSASSTEGCNSTITMKDNADPFEALQFLTSSKEPPGGRQTVTEAISNDAIGGQKASKGENDKPMDALVSMFGTKDYINAKNLNNCADPFEAWQGFAISHGRTGGFSNMLTQSVDLQDTDYGDSSRSEYFSGALNRQKHSIEMNDGQFDSLVSSNRMNGTDEETVLSSTVQVAASSDDYTNASTLETSNSKIEKLLSDMPDLSFMLDSNLSIPKKVGGSHLNS